MSEATTERNAEICKITLAGMVPPSPNKLRREYRHWGAYKKLRDNWQRTIWGLIKISERNELLHRTIDGTLGADEESSKPLTVKIHIAHKRLFDPDNLPASVKPILDSLVRLGYIADDSNKHIALTVTQEVSREVGTTITIGECE